uniref:Endo/exonuclease/phosphatase domain-containing protein n=1 Tax=Panagrellus redivivus TaxID=6233 RepID=A0A7E4VIV0_PANRE
MAAIKNGTNHLRAMTFNLWLAGDNVVGGAYKIAKHIRIVDPDVVALQEVQYKTTLDELLDKLGPGYSGFAIHESPDSNIAIITKHLIDYSSMVHTVESIGFKITLSESNKSIHFYSLHLDHKSYGPYAANFKNVKNISIIERGERVRIRNVENLVALPEFQAHVAEAKEGGTPLIMAGDFNSPSHLDWTDAAKHLHGDWVIDWPASKLLTEKAHLKDSFREVHPNILQNPGTTWSTVHQSFSDDWDRLIPEVYDRIDFILYNSPKLIPVDSYTYSGNLPLMPQPFQRYNDYPSDHYAVITDFMYK